MLPGMSEHKEAINNLDDREFDRIRAIIQSMTPAERADVKVLNASRRQRIATGSGTQVSDVNQLVTRFARGSQDDEPDGQGRRHPGNARDARARRAMGGGSAGRRPQEGQEGRQEGQEGAGQRQPGQARPAGAGGAGRRRPPMAPIGGGPAGAAPDTLGDLPDAFTDLLGR